MEFTAIDFETANADRDSACSIGLATYKDGILIDEYYHLIRPNDLYFDPYNIEIHGITENMVKNEPTLKELWPEILPKVEGKQLVAHYAQFDMSVLRATLKIYNIEYPSFHYICSWLLAKKAFPNLLSYRLNTIAEYIGFKFEHHHALEDAKACAAIINILTHNNSFNDFHALAVTYDFVCGSFSNSGYTPCALPKVSNKTFNEIAPTCSSFNTEHYFYGKKIAFTGTLLSMPRKDAVQKIVDKGAEFSPGINKKTNILVFGYQNPKKFAADATNSSKYLKAQQLAEAGASIEIINEDDFVKILES